MCCFARFYCLIVPVKGSIEKLLNKPILPCPLLLPPPASRRPSFAEKAASAIAARLSSSSYPRASLGSADRCLPWLCDRNMRSGPSLAALTHRFSRARIPVFRLRISSPAPTSLLSPPTDLLLLPLPQPFCRLLRPSSSPGYAPPSAGEC